MGVSPVGASRHLRLETEPTHWWEVGALNTAPTLFAIVYFFGQTNKCWTTVFFYFNYFVSLIRPFPVVSFTSQLKSVIRKQWKPVFFLKNN